MRYWARLVVLVFIFVLVTVILNQMFFGTSPTTQMRLVQPRPTAVLRAGALAKDGSSNSCSPQFDYPLVPLEQELDRIWDITEKVMRKANATYWPTDGTLLGLMRNGRVTTDRDLDFQVHSTYDSCYSFLAGLKSLFEQHAKIKSFKVVKAKYNGKKIGRYVMVRLFRKFGTFDTGPDFNCVYMDGKTPHFFTHRGILTPVPSQVFPLGRCLAYNRTVLCPKDGYSVLESLAPRYVGCMVFPHCFGNPLHSSKKCLSPHPRMPLTYFVNSTRRMQRCGFANLAKHFENEKSCRLMLESRTEHCEIIDGDHICFLQKFDG